MILHLQKMKELTQHLGQGLYFQNFKAGLGEHGLVVACGGQRKTFRQDEYLDYSEFADHVVKWGRSVELQEGALATSRVKCHKSASLRLHKDLKPRGSGRPALVHRNKLRRKRISLWPTRPGFGAEPTPQNSPYHYHESRGPLHPYRCPNCGSPSGVFNVLCTDCAQNGR